MSTTIELRDKFSAATEVTSLATSDRVLAIDANGDQKKISRTNLANQGFSQTFSADANSAGRWVRIAKMSNYGSSCMLTISSGGFSGGWIYPLTMLVTAPHAGSLDNISIVSLCPQKANTVNSSYPCSKIRVTGAEETKYIDIFVANSYARTLNIVISCAMFSSLVTPAENPAVGNKVKEFDVSDLWGGGKLLSYNQLRNFTERRVA